MNNDHKTQTGRRSESPVNAQTELAEPGRRRFLGWTGAGLGLGLIGAGNALAQTAGNARVSTWAGATDLAIWDAAWAARFSNPLPSLTAPGFIYRPDVAGGNAYTVAAGQVQANVLGIRRAGAPLLTTAWGYGPVDPVSGQPQVSHPGRSFVVQQGSPIQVNWRNDLVDAQGQPLPHILPVDQTVMLQNDPANNPIDGVPIATHHHGGDTMAEFDGVPDQWVTPRRRQTGPGIQLGTPGDVGVNGDILANDGSIRYQYDNTEEASLTWYHDHAEGLTRLNAYAGLAGAYVVRDSNEAELIRRNLLPSGPHEVGLVLQDKVFDADGQFAYPADSILAPVPTEGLDPSLPTHLPEMYGDVICVNGVVWPKLDVEPRPYRLRLLNGSDSRFYTLTFDTTGGVGPFLGFRLIGTDMGFGNNAPMLRTLTIGPGERYDLVINFAGLAANATVVLRNTAPTPYPLGAPVVPGSGPDEVMAFKVTKAFDRAYPKLAPIEDKTVLRGWVPLGKPAGTPSSAPRLPALRVPAGAPVRRVLLGEGSDEFGRIMPLLGTVAAGTLGFHEPSTENVVIPAGQTSVTEVWEFWNASVDSHPVHLHLVRFRVLNRQTFTCTLTPKPMINNWTGVTITDPAAPQPVLARAVTAPFPYETGWKDTVECPPGVVTRVLVTFNRPGKYVYHCHILSHEEHDMMRWFTVTKA
ncbi:multicopper oxidase family protein [Sphaerotilus mobilis]|uniref:Spore coat protein A n=1 Tax=Sphaerotilus mobilis TaxID=47994 RepID=A0A4V2EVM4_9BURK|nr:multicopper oxidase domain-containing protein [Sphaerotilus mobilis]RZS53000.1 spore coat protein A [Sphaerotilus mobilis]